MAAKKEHVRRRLLIFAPHASGRPRILNLSTLLLCDALMCFYNFWALRFLDAWRTRRPVRSQQGTQRHNKECKPCCVHLIACERRDPKSPQRHDVNHTWYQVLGYYNRWSILLILCLVVASGSQFRYHTIRVRRTQGPKGIEDPHRRNTRSATSSTPWDRRGAASN